MKKATELQSLRRQIDLFIEGNGEAFDPFIQIRELVLCSLPHKATSERSITRVAQLGPNTVVNVTFTTVGKQLAYGSDRTLLGWFQTKCLEGNSSVITFDHLIEYLRAFDLDDGGKSYKRFYERLQRVLDLAIAIRVYHIDDRGSTSKKFTLNTFAVRAATTPNLQQDDQHVADDASLTPSDFDKRFVIITSDDFFKVLHNQHVVMPLQLMKIYSDRPIGWDFCQLILYRCFSAKTPSVIPWSSPETGGIKELVGSEDVNDRQLKYKLNGILDEIKIVYPDLPAYFLPSLKGLHISPWKPPQAHIKQITGAPSDRKRTAPPER